MATKIANHGSIFAVSICPDKSSPFKNLGAFILAVGTGIFSSKKEY